jgi:PilZ domain
MVGWLGRRTEPRVGFRHDVRVIWPGRESAVLARAVNLSSTGILVDAPTPAPCPVGSPILCDVSLPRGPLRLRGRVAHRRVLSPANVGMGIAFVDLSPRVVAELRDVVEESDEKAQLVKVRFAGTSRILCTRALPTAGGFQFTTPLPFLRAGTEVDITVSPDAPIGTKGWVSAVALDRAQQDGIPRLVIDIRAADVAPLQPASDAAPPGDLAPDETGAMPERLWEPGDFTATNETPPEFPEIDLAGHHDPDKTEIVRIRDVSRRRRGPRVTARAHTLAFAAAALAVVAVVVAFAVRVSPRRTSAASGAAAPPPVAVVPPSIEPIAAPLPTIAAATMPRVESTDFTVGLIGSLAGARRYPLHTPDGVAFNLPRAQATLQVGTYRPAIKGLRAVWVRNLPGGGTHLRFFYSKSGPVPDVRLHSDGVSVVAR